MKIQDAYAFVRHDLFGLRPERPSIRTVMYRESQQIKLNPTFQPANEDNSMRMKRALSALQLLIGVTSTLFIAGIVIPNLLRSAAATSHALAVGSLHVFSIGRVTFPYEFQGIAFAILGSLLGAAAALAIDSPATIGKVARIVRMVRHAEWKCVESRKNGQRSYIGDRKLA